MIQFHSDNTLEAALIYASWGWHIMPIRAGMKRPAINDWCNEATTDEKTIRAWWETFTTNGVNPNIGLLTGKKSRVVVVDVDPRNEGHLHIEELLQELQAKSHLCKPFIVSKTGGGGTHYFFEWPDHIPFIRTRSGKNGLRPGIELKADQALVVLPPSIHPSGVAYEWMPIEEPAS